MDNKRLTEQEIVDMCNKFNCLPHQLPDYLRQEDNKKNGRILCERCEGTGNEFFSMYRKCPDCDGAGHITFRKIKIYEMNDVTDWVAASSLEEAIQYMKEYYGNDEEIEIYVDNPRELTEAELEEYVFTNEDGSKGSFKTQLEELHSMDSIFPCLFASTEY